MGNNKSTAVNTATAVMVLRALPGGVTVSCVCVYICVCVCVCVRVRVCVCVKFITVTRDTT